MKSLETRIQPVFGSDLIKVIVEVLASSAGQIRQHGVNVSQLTAIGDCRHLAFFPRSEMAAVLEELITNACRAMREAAVRNLSFRLDYAADRVIIDVSDTGEGIAVDDPEILFGRQFSTKVSDGGYGLFHARQRIQRFGGRIRIFNNPDGRGATVRMTFKGIPREGSIHPSGPAAEPGH
jgi:signal transduction histidine kinase